MILQGLFVGPSAAKDDTQQVKEGRPHGRVSIFLIYKMTDL